MDVRGHGIMDVGYLGIRDVGDQGCMLSWIKGIRVVGDQEIGDISDQAIRDYGCK